MTLRHWVLVGAAVLFLWALGGHDLWAPDEPYFAEGAREMVADGRWAVPHVNGVVTTDKPPLFFWLIALVSLPFGAVTEWTARLPSALAALGTVALVLRIGRRRFGPRTAALAGVILATTYLFWDKARWSQTDALLCFLIWVALAAFDAHRAGEIHGSRAGLLFWVAAALAVLTKGPVGLLLPLGIAVVTLAFDRRLSHWRRFAPVAGPFAFALVVGAWMVAATVGGGGEYSVWGALREHFVERGVHGMHHRQPPWYYAQTLPVSLLPWTGLVPGALVLAWRRRLPVDRFLLVAALFPVVFFSLSTEKRDLYVLPAMPAFALLAAALVAAVCGWNEARGDTPVRSGWVSGGQGAVGGLLTLVGSALLVPAVAARAMAEAPVSAMLVGAVGVALAATGIATLLFALRRSPGRAVLATAAGIALLYLLVVTWVYPALEGRKSARPFTERLAQETRAACAAGQTIVTHGLSNLPEAFAFYGDGLYTVEMASLDQVEEHLAGPAGLRWAVVDGETWERLEERRVAAEVVATDRLARRDVLLVRGGSAGEGASSP